MQSLKSNSINQSQILYTESSKYVQQTVVQFETKEFRSRNSNNKLTKELLSEFLGIFLLMQKE